MKLKKAYIYIASFTILSFLFSTCYYLSYRHALKEFNNRAIERYQNLSELTNYSNPTQAPDIGNDDSMIVGINPSDTIHSSTKYILITYDKNSGKENIEELKPPSYLVGLSREEVISYLSEYMDDLTLSEFNKGLISFELMKFSDEEVILKKTYNEGIVAFRYYVVVKDGFVVVYNSDLKSIHSYTSIEARYLPEKDRTALSKGIYVNSEDELYSLLESYSS